METSELDFVLRQLQERKGSWPQIAKETGIAYSSLSKMARGDIEDPGVRKVEVLARYFRLLGKHESERAGISAPAREAAA
jgi:hypothetical protein